MSNDNFKGTLLRHVTALLIIWSLLIFLGIALLAPINGPDVSNLTATAEGIVVGGFVGIIASVITSLYQTESNKQAARSASDAHDAGVAAAMTPPPGTAQPGDPTVVPTFVPTEDPATAGVFMCPVDGSTFTAQADLDQHIAEVHPPQTGVDSGPLGG